MALATTNANQGFNWGTVKDFANGVFSTGLDYLSQELNFKRQIELLKIQGQMDAASKAQATQTNAATTTEATPQFAPSTWGLGLGGISPIAIAVVGVAAILLIRKK